MSWTIVINSTSLSVHVSMSKLNNVLVFEDKENIHQMVVFGDTLEFKMNNDFSCGRLVVLTRRKKICCHAGDFFLNKI